MSKIRTRFAPSPTGRMHVGNLRTALYAYLIAKHEGGDFILRIEDTDQVRQVEGAVDIINRTLEETGLFHDEGPDKDGGCGPYVQSERVAQGIYMKYAKELIDKGEAYYCFCDKERLDSLKTTVAGKEISIYDKHCKYSWHLFESTKFLYVDLSSLYGNSCFFVVLIFDILTDRYDQCLTWDKYVIFPCWLYRCSSTFDITDHLWCYPYTFDIAFFVFFDS